MELPVDMRLPCADANRTCAEVRASNMHILQQWFISYYYNTALLQQQYSNCMRNGPALQRPQSSFCACRRQ
jgi:hypothetical protein